MGIKHLVDIMKIFEENKTEYFTSTKIRDITGYNYYTVMDIISYMLQYQYIIKKIMGNSVYYIYNKRCFTWKK